MELLKLLSTNELVAQVISFLIFFFVLRALAWKKILQMLDERKDRIQGEIKRVDEMKLDIEKLKGEYDAKMRSIEQAARERTREAIADGQRIADEIKKTAEESAERMIANAEETIAAELVKAKEEIKTSMVDLTIAVAEKVIEERLGSDQDRKLVEGLLSEVDTLERKEPEAKGQS